MSNPAAKRHKRSLPLQTNAPALCRGFSRLPIRRSGSLLSPPARRRGRRRSGRVALRRPPGPPVRGRLAVGLRPPLLRHSASLRARSPPGPASRPYGGGPLAAAPALLRGRRPLPLAASGPLAGACPPRPGARPAPRAPGRWKAPGRGPAARGARFALSLSRPRAGGWSACGPPDLLRRRGMQQLPRRPRRDAPDRKLVQDFFQIPARETGKAAPKGGFSLILII